MTTPAYTLAMYRVHAGREEEFIITWGALARAFTALPEPPLCGTLIRSRNDRTLFYSFGPWREAAHVTATRANRNAQQAFARLQQLCAEMTPGDYELIEHVQVRE